MEPVTIQQVNSILLEDFTPAKCSPTGDWLRGYRVTLNDGVIFVFEQDDHFTTKPVTDSKQLPLYRTKLRISGIECYTSDDRLVVAGLMP